MTHCNRTDILVHYGSKPLGQLYSVAQDKPPQMKPKGLWLSVDNCEPNWRTWCECERFELRNLVCSQEIVLNPEANVLRLRSAYELDKFTSKFDNHIKKYDCYSINWAAVAARYDGIIIAPYIWQRRLDLMWYYVWDCASGCIWNHRAIAEVRAGLKIKPTTSETLAAMSAIGNLTNPPEKKP